MPSLLTLSDVLGTGHHAALGAGVRPGDRRRVGDGAVGLCGVIAARRLGAEQIIILGRHEDRTALAPEFGATDVVPERGEEAIERVRELTGGHGAHSVLECVGTEERSRRRSESRAPAAPSAASASRSSTRSRGARRRSSTTSPSAAASRPLALTSRSCCPTCSRAAWSPGRVFDHTIELDGVPDGYRAMDDRESIKVLVKP